RSFSGDGNASRDLVKGLQAQFARLQADELRKVVRRGAMGPRSFVGKVLCEALSMPSRWAQAGRLNDFYRDVDLFKQHLIGRPSAQLKLQGLEPIREE